MNLFITVFKEAMSRLEKRLLALYEAEQENIKGDIFHRLTKIALMNLRLFQDEHALIQFVASALQVSQ